MCITVVTARLLKCTVSSTLWYHDGCSVRVLIRVLRGEKIVNGLFNCYIYTEYEFYCFVHIYLFDESMK